MKKENLLGQKFARLLVVAEAKHIGKRSAWQCKCDCGNIKIIKSEELKSGGTKSCGCLNKELNIERGRKMAESNIKFSPDITTARKVWKNRYDDELSFEDFYSISQMNCFYCDANPNNSQNAAILDKKSSQFAKDNGNFIYNGLDRVNNSLSHTADNVVACCKWCNYAKRERTVAEFKAWIERVYITMHK